MATHSSNSSDLGASTLTTDPFKKNAALWMVSGSISTNPKVRVLLAAITSCISVGF